MATAAEPSALLASCLKPAQDAISQHPGPVPAHERRLANSEMSCRVPPVMGTQLL